MLLDDAGFEERPDQVEDLAVFDPLFHQVHEHPVVDVVETGCDVAFDDPFVVRRPAGHMVDLGNGILGSPPGPIPVTRRVEVGFVGQVLRCL
jgi:hypothetical protein